MTELTTTLNEIRKHDPCVEGWEKVLRFLGKTGADDEPLTLLTVLESNGLDDALWGLRALDPKYDNAVRLYACFCARYSLDTFEKQYPEDKRPRHAIETAERYARGQANEDDLVAAGDAIWDAVRATAGDAIWDAAGAARYTTWAAACAAAGDAARVAAWDAARAAAVDAARAAARDAAVDTARDAARDAFTAEFKRLCRLEGEYGKVVD